ncbi:glycosyltransferase family 2 protein [Flavobacterium sp.]|jgi:glycosyltransferase involved in cell wall biosynthesis|uniref:glycosyltransferase family 2 protein n=1 Tax=Flavobacterium sp. TaxID=239 RepID=UPI0022BE15ED|nr:glycosyltransferase [Flavobacterium sp.]MCZ8169796.1 glycosyltransferase [Flavobacterium sp.]
MPSPKISVMIPTYNCAALLRKTLASVLEQDLGPELMQIEVIDDCSTDHPEAVVAELGKGRVMFFQQPYNVKHVKNFQTALSRAQGEIIHLLHGDDFVLPGFYTQMLNMYAQYPEIKACFTQNHVVNSANEIIHTAKKIQEHHGIIPNFFEMQVKQQLIQTPSITVKKEVYETLGTFNPTLSWTEDWEMWARIAKYYPIGYIAQPLACYRVHTQSSTSTKSIIGENVNDLKRIKVILCDYCHSTSLKKEVSQSLNRIIFNTAQKNYQKAFALKSRHVFTNLITLITYSPNVYNVIYHSLIYIKLKLLKTFAD